MKNMMNRIHLIFTTKTSWAVVHFLESVSNYFMPGPDIWTTPLTRPRSASRMPSPPSSPLPIMSWGCRWPGTLSGRDGATFTSSKILLLWRVTFWQRRCMNLRVRYYVAEELYVFCVEMWGYFFLCLPTLQNAVRGGDSHSHQAKKHFFVFNRSQQRLFWEERVTFPVMSISIIRTWAKLLSPS